MNEILAFAATPLGEGAIFTAAVVFGVVTLEAARVWLERRPALPQAGAALAVLGLMYLAMLVGGAADYFASGHVTFLNLGLFVNGAATSGIWLGLVAQTFGRAFGWVSPQENEELRRIAAQDL